MSASSDPSAEIAGLAHSEATTTRELGEGGGGVAEWRRLAPLIPLLAVAAVVLLAPVRHGGLVGDDWEHLRLAQRSWGSILTEPLSYHYIPLGGALHKAVRCLAGDDGFRWALANAAALFAAAAAVLWLAVRLFRDALTGLLAACLLLGSAAYHEVTFWPTVGVVFGFSGVLFAVSLGIGFRLPEDDAPISRSVAFAVTAGAASLTYPGAVSAMPAAVLWFAARRYRPDRGRRSELRPFVRSFVRAFAPCVPVLGIIAAARVTFSDELSAATRFGFDAERLKYLAEGVASVFSLQGSRTALHAIVTFGLVPDGGSALAALAAAVFVALMVALAILVVRLLPFTGEAFLAVAFVVHFAAMAPWVAVSPRHCFLSSLIGLPLAVRLLGRGAERARRRLLPRHPGFVPAAAALASVLVLLAAREPFLHAANLWARSARAYEELGRLVGERSVAQPGMRTLVTVDLPSFLTEGGFTVPFASYNLPRFVSFLEGGLQVERVRLRPERPGFVWGSGVSPVTLRRVQEMVLDSSHLVVRFDARSRSLVRLSPEGFSVVNAVTPDRSPELGWREGAWPWLLSSPGEELELLLSASPGGWLALRYLAEPSSSFDVDIDGAPSIRVRPVPGAPSGWRTTVCAIPNGSARPGSDGVVVQLRPSAPVALAGIWVFLPSNRITPMSAPFLGWYGSPEDASFEVSGLLDLPLRRRPDSEDGPGEIGFSVLASPRHSGQMEADGRAVILDGKTESAAHWIERSIAVGSRETVILRVRSDGIWPLRFRSIRLTSPAGRAGHADTPSITPDNGQDGNPSLATGSTR